MFPEKKKNITFNPIGSTPPHNHAYDVIWLRFLEFLLGDRIKIIFLSFESADSIIAIFSALHSGTTNIIKLDISGCTPLGPNQEIAYHIEDSLKQNPKLQRLHLRKIGLRDSGIERIAYG